MAGATTGYEKGGGVELRCLSPSEEAEVGLGDLPVRECGRDAELTLCVAQRSVAFAAR
jgi:hypothetical protein